MKRELIDKLFKEFDKDQNLIKENLLKVMNIIHLETEDEYGRLEMAIKYERKD